MPRLFLFPIRCAVVLELARKSFYMESMENVKRKSTLKASVGRVHLYSRSVTFTTAGGKKAREASNWQQTAMIEKHISVIS